VLIPAIALLGRYLLIPVLGSETPFVLLYPSVLVVAWWAGRGPALITIAIGSAGSMYLLIDPRYSLEGSALTDVLNVALATIVLLLIAGVTTALQAARQRAERLVERERGLQAQQRELLLVRDAFASMMGHELRTPITVILGQAQLMARQPSLPPALAEAALDIKEESERLHLLTEDLLILNRGEAGIEVAPEPVLVHRIVERIVGDSRQRLPSRPIAVHIESHLPPALADNTYVEQIIRNLLSNAIKYGRPKATIAIEVRHTGQMAHVAVTNEGVTVPEGDEARIFDLFYRSEATAGGRPGTGVGLYVTRSLATAMRGRVWAERRPTGMRFHLQLPLASGDDGCDPGEPACHSGGASR
jgi:signal transduction histidine kinase